MQSIFEKRKCQRKIRQKILWGQNSLHVAQCTHTHRAHTALLAPIRRVGKRKAAAGSGPWQLQLQLSNAATATQNGCGSRQRGSIMCATLQQQQQQQRDATATARAAAAAAATSLAKSKKIEFLQTAFHCKLLNYFPSFRFVVQFANSCCMLLHISGCNIASAIAIDVGSEKLVMTIKWQTLS